MRTSYLIVLCCAAVFAQNTTTAPASIAGAGYIAPSNVTRAAPGQVISLMVRGLDHRLDTPVTAAGSPLADMLAGISVSFQQGNTTLAVPLLGISQSPCNYPDAYAGLCQSLTIISIQMPFEVFPDCPVCGRPTIPSFLVVSDGGTPKAFMTTSQPADNIHITDACDTTALLGRNDAVACGKIIVHPDGTRVDVNRPAKVGETLVLYAFGLGRTTPLVASGTATADPPPQLPVSGFSLSFDYTPNASPSPVANPFFGSHPVYVGLVSGFVGLYQVNFVVPPPAGAAIFAACGGSVLSNATVTLFTPLSNDGAGICVVP